MDQVPEQLFLDIPLADTQEGTSGTRTTEPWKTLYYNAILENRYGDAIYARYSLDGRSPGGINLDTQRTILEEIRLNARDYYRSEPEMYAEALVFYEQSRADLRPEVIEVLRGVPYEWNSSAS